MLRRRTERVSFHRYENKGENKGDYRGDGKMRVEWEGESAGSSWGESAGVRAGAEFEGCLRVRKPYWRMVLAVFVGRIVFAVLDGCVGFVVYAVQGQSM